MDHERHILGAGQDRHSEYRPCNHSFYHRHLSASDATDHSPAEILEAECEDESGTAGDSEKVQRQERQRFHDGDATGNERGLCQIWSIPYGQLSAAFDPDADPVCALQGVFQRARLCGTGKGSVFPAGGKAGQRSGKRGIFEQHGKFYQRGDVCQAV